MTLTFSRLLGDAFALFRREADLLLRIAGPFLFLPTLALQLLVPAPPPLPVSREEPALEAWVQNVGIWGQDHAIWYLLVDAFGLIGIAAIILLLTDASRPDVRAALGQSIRLLPRYALAAIVAGIPIGLGLWVFILPGLYMQARLIAFPPVLLAERPIGAVRSLNRSWRITRPAAFALFGATTALMLASWVATSPFLSLDTWLRVPAHDNPFVIGLVDMLLAAIQTAYELALALVGVAAWKRLSRQGT